MIERPGFNLIDMEHMERKNIFIKWGVKFIEVCDISGKCNYASGV